MAAHPQLLQSTSNYSKCASRFKSLQSTCCGALKGVMAASVNASLTIYLCAAFCNLDPFVCDSLALRAIKWISGLCPLSVCAAHPSKIKHRAPSIVTTTAVWATDEQACTHMNIHTQALRRTRRSRTINEVMMIL